MERLEEAWRKPDNGIWESRAEPRHYTYSKAMCWLALQQLTRLLPEAPERHRWERESELVRKDIETRGFDSSCGGYIAAYGMPAADASLLLLSRIGFHQADHPRLRGTFDFIDRRLREDEALLGRCSQAPEAGNQVPDNLFAACGFWAAEHLALAGDRVAARRRFESLLSHANDVGLYAEEFESGSHRHVGNFPQALTHISLISAALALDQHPGSHRGTR